MSVLIDLIAAAECSKGFKVGWKRVRHVRHGHPYEQWELIDKLYSEKHPHTDGEYIFTVGIHRCKDCGLTFVDDGLSLRAPED